jgi:hypothetical protein
MLSSNVKWRPNNPRGMKRNRREKLSTGYGLSGVHAAKDFSNWRSGWMQATTSAASCGEEGGVFFLTSPLIGLIERDS